MSNQNDNSKAAADKSANKKDDEPKVEAQPSFAKGEKVRHDGGGIYEIEEVHPSGIQLKGVANLVNPQALSKAG